METQLDNVGTIPGTKLLLSKCYPFPTLQVKIGDKMFSVQEHQVIAMDYKQIPYHPKHLPVFVCVCVCDINHRHGFLPHYLLPLALHMVSYPSFSFIWGSWG